MPILFTKRNLCKYRERGREREREREREEEDEEEEEKREGTQDWRFVDPMKFVDKCITYLEMYRNIHTSIYLFVLFLTRLTTPFEDHVRYSLPVQ